MGCRLETTDSAIIWSWLMTPPSIGWKNTPVDLTPCYFFLLATELWKPWPSPFDGFSRKKTEKNDDVPIACKRYSCFSFKTSSFHISVLSFFVHIFPWFLPSVDFLSLVGGWALPLWKMMDWKSVGVIFPHGKIIHSCSKPPTSQFITMINHYITIIKHH